MSYLLDIGIVNMLLRNNNFKQWALFFCKHLFKNIGQNYLDDPLSNDVAKLLVLYFRTELM